MSHFLDRLKFMSKVKSTFSNGHGAVVKEDRQWEDAYRASFLNWLFCACGFP